MLTHSTTSVKNRRSSPLYMLWKRLRKNKFALCGLFILVLLILTAISAPLLTDYKTQVIKQNMKDRLKAPSAQHLLGTDSYGRDTLARVVYGSRYSLSIGFLTVCFALAIGGLIGSIAGYFGGVLDNILMRCMDVLLSIPSIIMAIAIVAALGTGFSKLVLALGVSNIPRFARLFRSTILTIRDAEFVEAARLIGASTWRIVTRHILVNSMGPIIVQTTFTVANAILVAASMSFLGLGIQPPAPEWGAMLSEGKDYIRYSSWLVLFPGSAIALTVLSLNLLGDGLRDALDPRLRQ